MPQVNAGRLEQNEDGVRLIMTEEGGKSLARLVLNADLSRWNSRVFYSVPSLWKDRFRVAYVSILGSTTMLTGTEASRWAGVVSAAITMSDVKDEIDLVSST